MALGGKAVMMNWSDVAPEHHAAYYAWHNREHMITAVALPGFRRGRRFIALDADRTFFNLYEVDELAVLASPDYMARTSRPSELTRSTTQHVRNAIRGLAHVRYTRGAALGGVMLTLRLGPAAGRAAELEAFLAGTALPAALADSPAVLAAHLCIVDPAASSVMTPERKGRPTAIPEWAVCVEGVTRAALERAADAHLSESALRRHGAGDGGVRGVYAFEMMAIHGAPGD